MAYTRGRGGIGSKFTPEYRSSGQLHTVDGAGLTFHDSRAPDQWGPRASSWGFKVCRPATAGRRAGGAGDEVAVAAAVRSRLISKATLAEQLYVSLLPCRDHAFNLLPALTQGWVGVGVCQGSQGGQQKAGEATHGGMLLCAMQICQGRLGYPGRGLGDSTSYQNGKHSWKGAKRDLVTPCRCSARPCLPWLSHWLRNASSL